MGYQFKVGDKGKTRDGRPYEILAIGLEQIFIRTIVNPIYGERILETTRTLEGRIFQTGTTSDEDLLPPTKTLKRWIRIVRPYNNEEGYISASFKSKPAITPKTVAIFPVKYEFTEGQGLD